ncbi:hypothetical protein [Aneurinibacillus aneurinilyticus]|jgi:hypothetical protein|nr:hypothetical protein [Aneurinibacillus aneurinilyticus]MCI1696812.1 hypothetical protein [Aneurinibacillus aneurinilyticus]
MGKPQITKYDTHVKPRFADIYKWVREGLVDVDIAQAISFFLRNRMPEQE